jgi:hypothetical protein
LPSRPQDPHRLRDGPGPTSRVGDRHMRPSQGRGSSCGSVTET